MKRVYLDNAATTTLSPAAAVAMAEVARDFPANPNALHSSGRAAFSKLEELRARCAELLGASRPSEIVFTSGGTESDVAALLGISQRCAVGRSRVLVSAMEHHAVLECAAQLKAQGRVMEQVNPDRDGFVTDKLLSQHMGDDVCLVSVHMANNEVGTIQPIGELAACAHGSGAFMHTDGVQAPGRLAIDLRKLTVDAASFSAHKFHGPRGVGILYLKGGTPFAPLITGGGQEEGLRSGTQNVAGVAGMVAALEEVVAEQETECLRLAALRDELVACLQTMEGVQVLCDPTGDTARHLANLVACTVDNAESEMLVLMLDRAGFEVSGGSACSSRIGHASHVLLALGIDEEQANGQLRMTLGRETTQEDVLAFAHALQEVTDRVRG